MSIQDELHDFMESASDWDKMQTNVPGLFIVKVPRKNGARLMVEVNPVDGAGKQIKRKGLFLSNQTMFMKFFEIFSTPELNTIMGEIDALNPGNSKQANVVTKTLTIS